MTEIESKCPIRLIPEDSRKTTLPLARPNIYKWYKDAVTCFWTVEEINMSVDNIHYETKLTPQMKHFVDYVLAFFASSDAIVNINLAERFKNDVPILEVAYFYDFQMMIENVHAETYSLLLDSIITDKTKRDKLLRAAETIPIVTKMTQYIYKCIEEDTPFAERLLKMACVEGIFFTGCFCMIYWLQQKGLMPGLAHSNELIARDEALHTIFALYLYTLMENEYKLTVDRVHEIMKEAVEISKEFMKEAILEGLPNFSLESMFCYIECQADNIVTLIDIPNIYNSTHDFKFMEQLNVTNKTNFFERRVSEYSKRKQAETGDFVIESDF